MDHDLDPGTLDLDLDCYQNVINCSLGHVPPLQKYRQNPYITFSVI